MPLYAASSIMLVAPSEAQGGCGAVHTRPVTHGAPAKVWKLDCPKCHDALKDDPLWSGTEQEIPETIDEKRAREESEKKSAMETQAQVAGAFEKLALSLQGNQEAMGKMAELMALVVGQQLPKPAVQGEVLQRAREVESPATKSTTKETWDYHACRVCGAEITREPGQRGALPVRCPEHRRR